jgi:hypothetical protein
VTNDPVLIDPEQQRLVLKIITNGPRARTTLWVWNRALLHIQRDRGEITASGR